MDRAQQYSWPTTCVYNHLPKEIPHAIGVISVNWGFVEAIHEQILTYYLGTDRPVSAIVTTHQSIDARTRMLVALLQIKEPDARTKEGIERFIACLEAAKHNRNAILHAICYPGPGGATLVSRTAKKKPRVLDLKFDALSLAQIADDIRAVYHFGGRLHDVLTYRDSGDYCEFPDLLPIAARVNPIERSIVI